jgi:hypothetical protein
LTDDDFWQYIAILNGKLSKKSVNKLDSLLRSHPEQIAEFGELLARRLYDLDTVEHYEQPLFVDPNDPDEEGDLIDGDDFQDRRFGAVAAGKAVYERILADPAEFRVIGWDDIDDSMRMLNLMHELYAAYVPGLDRYDPSVGIDTGANPLGFQEEPPEPGWAGPGEPGQATGPDPETG